jgi:hypothetical protein
MTPPWNDMPPSHSAGSRSDSRKFGRLVEEHVAEPAAEDDAERRVEDHVVGVAPRHRRAGPVDQLQQIPPADEDAGEIGERTSAAGTSRFEQDRIEPEILKWIARAVDTMSVSRVDQGFPLRLQRPHRGGKRKAKGESDAERARPQI